jgi:PHS family inorganic phosphate transporter-like MFS transporter
MSDNIRGLRRKLRQVFWRDQDPESYSQNVPTPQQQEAYLDQLEDSRFNKLVFAVAASGFLTDSYNLFASNVVLPALAYVYWHGPGHQNELFFNISTLVGSAFGQLVFGVLADIWGRQSLYGKLQFW